METERPKRNKGKGRAANDGDDESSGDDDEFGGGDSDKSSDSGKQNIRITKKSLEKMMSNAVEQVMMRTYSSKGHAGGKSPSKKRKENADLKAEKALDKDWQRRNFCVSDLLAICAS